MSRLIQLRTVKRLIDMIIYFYRMNHQLDVIISELKTYDELLGLKNKLLLLRMLINRLQDFTDEINIISGLQIISSLLIPNSNGLLDHDLPTLRLLYYQLANIIIHLDYTEKLKVV